MSKQPNKNNLFENNLEYFKNNFPHVYEKISILNSIILDKSYTPRFLLEYKNKQYDIFDIKTKKYFYNNFKNYLNNINKSLSRKHENTFNTLHEYAYSLGEDTKVSPEIEHIKQFLTPYTDYINKHTPTSKTDKEFKQIHKLMIIGTGTGLHLDKVIDYYKPSSILLIEPNPEVFRLSLFCIDYEQLFKKITATYLSIGENNLDLFTWQERFLVNNFTHNYIIKFFLTNDSYSEYLQYFAGVLQMISPFNFDHIRMLSIVKKTTALIKAKQKFINLLTHNFKIFEQNPVLILGAGPSLKYNIEWLEKNHTRFIIVAAASSLPRLEKHNIRPDIIASLDAHSKIADQFKINNKSILDDNILLFSSMTNQSTFEQINAKNVYIYEVLSSIKLDSSLPSLTASNVGEISYAIMLILKARNIYLLGIDAAIDHITGSTHDEVTSIGGVVKYDINKKHTLEDTKIDMLDIVETQGNFVPIVKTTRIFYNSVLGNIKIAELYKKENQTVYNLSNGAFFKYTTPLKPEEMDLTNFPIINKLELSKDLKNEFEANSSTTLTLREKYNLSQQISTLDVLLKALFEFQKVKKIKTNIEFDAMRISIARVLTEATIEHKTYLSKIFQTYFQLTEDYINYFFNDKNLKNEAQHIKKIKKIWCDEVIKILEEYKQSLSSC